MKRLLFILVCLCTYAIAFAQNITVSGTVTASDGGDALIGVTVKSVKGKEAAVTDWSVETVAMCAERQAQILDTAAKLLRPGGRL